MAILGAYERLGILKNGLTTTAMGVSQPSSSSQSCSLKMEPQESTSRTNSTAARSADISQAKYSYQSATTSTVL